VIATIQVLLFLGLALVALGLEAWALIDAASRRAEAFSYAGKRTRGFWLLLLGGATVAGFLAIPAPLGLGIMPVIVMLAAVVPAGVYLADVRPAVRGYGRGRRPGQGGW
jgi:hypothetical protein